jgi:heme-degrading monooxygenase HmoA
MLFKLIVATVPDELRTIFSTNQAAAWEGAGSLPGFLVQTGGWEVKNPNCAIVIAYWKNEQSYAEFMAGQHDVLTESMRKTYTALEIGTGHVITTVNQTDPKTAVAEAAIVRVTDCTLLPDCSPTFLAAQFSVWNPALAAADGMLMATVSRLGRAPDRFGVATFWKTGEALYQYQETLFPRLELQAKLREHIDKLTAYHAQLEPSWSVVGHSS